MRRRIFLFLLLIFLSSSVFSVPLELNDGNRFSLKNYFFHLRDESGALRLNDVVSGTNFEHTGMVNYGFDNAAHWFYCDLTNISEQEEWFLEIPFSPLDEIEFFDCINGKWTRKIAGDTYAIRTRDVEHTNPIFKFDLKKGETKRIFLRVKSTSSVQVSAVIWKPYEFFARSYNRQIINGLFYGALTVMILYQLFLFFSTRDKVSLYYVFTLLAMTHVVAYFQGYSFLYLYPDFPELNHYMAIITGPLFLIFSTALTRAFLNLKTINPFIDKLLLLNTVVDAMLGILMLISDGVVTYRYHHYAILIHSVIALAAASYSIYKGFKPALFYLLAWLALLVAAFIFSLSNLGVFSRNVTNSTWLIVGCIIQILFVSFALGNRWFIIIRENQNAKELELRRRQLEKEKLEYQVQVRTNEIQLKKEELEEVGRVKDKLFSIVSHDIKGPLTSLQLALGLIKSNTIGPGEFQELADVLETRFKQTTEFIENLLQWASIQLKGSTFDPALISLTNIVHATLALLDYEIKNKGVIVRNEVTSDVTVFADLNMLRSIMRNLLMNAIKFSTKDGLITIAAVSEGENILVSVSDTGVGIPEANRSRLFSLDSITTPGTHKEKGTGLGLLICKEFVEKNGGRIWFDSTVGEGTTFYFTLPSASSDESSKSISA